MPFGTDVAVCGKRLRLLCLFFSVLIITAIASDNARSQTSLNSQPDSVLRVLEAFVRPGFDVLSRRANEMALAMDTVCSDEGRARGLEWAQASFRGMVVAWSRVEFLRIGPLARNNRLERMLFWPDRRGRGLRQVRRALASEDTTVLDIETLDRKSVAFQGLGALEYLLFGEIAKTDLLKPSSFRCRFATTVARGMALRADAISNDWNRADGFSRIWLNPGSENERFRTMNEAESALISIISNALSLMQDTRLRPLASSNAKAALFWRSSQSLASLSANIVGLRDQLRISGLYDRLTGEAAGLDATIEFEFANALRTIARMQSVGPQNRGSKDLDYITIVVTSLQDLIGNELAPALQLSAGFSPTDGD